MSGYQIGPETFITISYQVFDAEGEAASDREVMGCVFGIGGLLPEVERALDGRVQGDTINIQLQQPHAYGERKPQSIVEVDRDDFPPDVAPGDRYEVENEHGGILVLHVLDVHDDAVVIDTNHPLAGQDVAITVEVLDVRPASTEEIEAALHCLNDDAGEQNHSDGAVRDALMPDVRAEDLIRRRPSA